MTFQPPIAQPFDAGSDTLSLSLLGGYVDASGLMHRDVEVSPLSGADEDALRRLPRGTALATVITALLGRCLRRVGTLGPPDIEVVRSLLVGDRDYLVLKLRELTLGPNAWFTLACPFEDCRKRMDLPLDLRRLPIESRPVQRRFFATEDGTSFRLPTGGDQEEVAALFAVHPEAAVSELLRRCLGQDERGEHSSRQLEEVEKHMLAVAPGLDIEFEAQCPECRQQFSTRLDLVPALIGELHALWDRIEDDVHVIAWNYHWSEREILALSRGKRSRYVRLIQRQLDPSWPE